ncbi:streptomycin 3'-adenylyltransferase [Geomicrobium halophilum]|uniref:Streptomycin 3'-adenylyltransferase n=1 Tax=Geomicrobium halophilum TaxID=549000 RepID=A0A841PT27_9BACL|nr:aminoglycoside adenylyltransferase domain-containing protein [Geomicrobium halophilum]MBB6449461.1 streptomycin 3'-adenylyltransferase [Geomicrobium halophilum]
MDDQIDDYLYQLTEVVNSVLEDRLVGLYLCGSTVLGDFNEKISDIDVLCIVKRPLKESEKRALAKNLSHQTLPSPGAGLEFYVVLEQEAAQPHSLLSYEFALLTGQDIDDKVKEEEMDEGLLMDFAINVQSGKTLTGRAKEEVFGSIPKPWLEEAMKGSLRWHNSHIFHPYYDPYGHEAVMNACRTWCFKETGVLTSKTRGTKWALKQWPYSEVIRRALAIRQGTWHELLDAEEIQQLLQFVRSNHDSARIPSAI